MVPSTGSRRVHRPILIAVMCALLGATSSLSPASAADPIPPAPPTNLSVSYSSGNAILSYTYSLGGGTYAVDGYRATCERDPFADVFKDVGIQNSMAVRLAPDVWLCDVRATAGPTVSARSAPVIVTVPALTAPTGFTATAELEAVSLQWDGLIDGSIDGYKIESAAASYVEMVPANTSPVKVVIHAVPFGVPLTFKVTPYRDSANSVRTFGPSVTSGSVTVRTVPDAPTITDTWVDYRTLEVHWSPPTETGGQPILGYQVTFLGAEGDVVVLPELGAGARRVSHDFVGTGLTWTAKIQARTVNGLGFPALSVALQPEATPGPVEGLFVSTTGPTTTFSWDTPAFVPPEIGLHRYRLELSGRATDAVTVIGDTTFIGEGLSEGWYQARVRMLDGLNESRWSSRYFVVGDPPCDSDFSDVTGPFCNPITWLALSGIGSGYPDGTFRPTLAVSRQAMAAFLYRAAGSPRGEAPPCATAPFPDVTTANPFCGHIDWLVDEGIATGFADGTFKPTQAVSRQAMAAFLVRASEEYVEVPCSASPFTDVVTSNPFCPAITALVGGGVVSGFSDGTFRPTVAVTRQAMASFLMRWHP